ncbi:MAG: type II toxin-antitoxin system RelE/ParE family toxin [Rhodothermia bacterium]
MRILFTPTARDQFLSALEYISRDNPSAALSFRKTAEESLTRLRDFPESGRVVPEFPDFPYREMIVRPYRFFCRVNESMIWIAGVWHDAQLPEEPSDE